MAIDIDMVKEIDKVMNIDASTKIDIRHSKIRMSDIGYQWKIESNGQHNVGFHPLLYDTRGSNITVGSFSFCLSLISK
jgi:hypothetical protein